MSIQEKYLRKNRIGIYEFRRRVPRTLQLHLKRSEIYRTLKTRSYRDALILCRLYAEESDKLFQRLRSQYTMSKKSAMDDFSKIARSLTKSEIKFDSLSCDIFAGKVEVRGLETEPGNEEQDLLFLERSVESVVKHASQAATVAASLQPQPQRLPLDIEQKLQETINNRLKSGAKPSAADTVTETLAPQQIQPHELTRITFSEVCDLFKDNQISGKSWKSPKTKSSYEGTFKLFEKFFNNRPIETYTRIDAANFRAYLQKMPAGWMRQADTKNLTYAEAIKLKKPTLTSNAVRDHLIRITALFDYAVTNDYVLKNIFGGVTVKKQKGTPRGPFTKEELHKLFEPRNFEWFQKEGEPSRFFAPLLAAFTGCRRGELFFLDVDSVYEKHGIWVLDINDYGLDDDENPNALKKVKGYGSKRIIPLHQKLIELGFLEFVDERRKDKTDKRLFKEYNIIQEQAGNGFTKAFSKWIEDTRSNLSAIEKKTMFPKYRGLHSFRHLFISESREKEISEAAARKLTGHAIPSEMDVHSDYGGTISETLQNKRLLALNDELQKLDPSTYFPKLVPYKEMMKKCGFN